MHRRDVPAEDAATQIDMRFHSEHYSQISDVGVHPHAVLRVYDLLNEEVAGR